MKYLEEGQRQTRIAAEISNSPEGLAVLRGNDQIITKTSALLTHVSIMVAICAGFLFAKNDKLGHWFTLVICLETVLYLLISLICLFSIAASTSRSFKYKGLSYLDQLIVITTRRRSIYRFALTMTIFLTIMVVVDMIWYAMFEVGVDIDFSSIRAIAENFRS